MNITSASATSSDLLLSTLETNGLSASKAQLVADDLSQVEASSALSASGASTSSPVDMQTMRAALDKKIDDDVSSGKLSQSDAAAVKKALDQMEGQTSGTETSGQAQASSAGAGQSDGAGAAQESGGGGGAKGGGGGGGAASKTEVSETVTVSGPLKTTVITYSDGSTASTTSVATETDEQKYGGSQAAQASADTAATKYLSTIAPGTLFNTMA